LRELQNELNRSKVQRTIGRLKRAKLVAVECGEHILTEKGKIWSSVCACFQIDDQVAVAVQQQRAKILGSATFDEIREAALKLPDDQRAELLAISSPRRLTRVRPTISGRDDGRLGKARDIRRIPIARRS
jgi:hypothetical protein